MNAGCVGIFAQLFLTHLPLIVKILCDRFALHRLHDADSSANHNGNVYPCAVHSYRIPDLIRPAILNTLINSSCWMMGGVL